MFGILEATSERSAYSSWIKEQLETHRRAVDLGLDHCVKCGMCCMARPCIPTPHELEKIADFLQLDLDDCIKQYFVIDKLGGEEQSFLFPAKETQKDITGTFVPWRRTYDRGNCIFFTEEDGCKIYEVRPKMARESECWNETDSKDLQMKAIEEWANLETPNKFQRWLDLAIEEFEY